MANWTPNDAIELRNSTVFQRALAEAQRMKPKADGRDSFEKRAMNAERRDGFDEAIEILKSLTDDRLRSDDKDHVDTERD